MDIGRIVREIDVEPLDEPILLPGREPAPGPERVPTEPDREAQEGPVREPLPA